MKIDEQHKAVGCAAKCDGKADILWRHAVTGDNYMYQMNGLTIQAAGSLPTVPDPNWKVVP